MNHSRRALAAIASCLLFSSVAHGEQVVQSIEWQDLAGAGVLTSGTVVGTPDGADGPTLRIVHRDAAAATFPLATVEHPPIRTAQYALRGRVKYEGVAAGSYLEMWSHLPDGAFFSRTLDRNGSMGRLDGSSGWRPFILPFFNREGAPPPEKLVFNLVLAGPGTVEIGPVQLVEFAAGDAVVASDGWWTGRQAGILGAVLGSALGMLGAVVGWLGSAGRNRRFVLGALTAMAWLGIGALLLGVLAFARGQPYEVYYPLALVGALGTALGFSLPRSLTRRYEELELRRMQAFDA